MDESLQKILTTLDATPSSIVRAAQKDDFSIKLFHEELVQCFSKLNGPRFVMKYQKELILLSDLFFYGLTTAIGNQTLGEEYSDVLQVNNYKPPSVSARSLIICFHTIFPYLFAKFCDKVDSLSRTLLYSKGGSSFLTPERICTIQQHTSILKSIAESFQRLHLATFYITGIFYSISKRIMNIRYISSQRKNPSNFVQYHLLGALIFIQFVITLALSIKKHHDKSDQRVKEFDDLVDLPQFESNKKCALCLENRKRSASTACGHIFCYRCITEWCNNKSECPLCRQPVILSTITCLHQY